MLPFCKKKKKSGEVWIAVGGTGGHIFPAEQLAFLLEEKRKKAFFIGAGLQENRFFSKEKYSFQEVKSCNFSLGIFRAFFLLFKSVCFCLYLVKKKRPEVVIGMGSFHSFPVLLAAYLKRIPLVIFEPNCALGKVNAFFAKKAKIVAMPFLKKEKENFFPVKPFPWVFPRSIPKLVPKEKKFFFLVFGGSQGSKTINQVIPKGLALLKKMGRDFEVFHITGEKTELSLFYKNCQIQATVSSFEKQMSCLYRKADIVIARSGAITLSEVLFYEKPTLFVPYPFASLDHQKENALFFCKEIGGGKVLMEEELTLAAVVKVLLEIEKNILVHQKAIQEFKKKQKGRDFSELVLELLSQ